jgi:hypothetical protein
MLASVYVSELHRSSVVQIFEFCVRESLPGLFCYLFTNWYSKKAFHLWARSSSDQVCIYRTNMFCESHFRLIKYDHLMKYNKMVGILFIF